MLPSSIVSVCLHVVLLLVAGMSLRGCEKGAPTPAGGLEYRNVGLAVIPDDSAPVEDQSVQTPQEQDASEASDSPPEQPQDTLPTKAPSLDELLGKTTHSDSAESQADADQMIPDIIGPGPAIKDLPSPGGSISELIRPQAAPGQGPGGSLTPGPGETSFMNIVGNGKSFVYVIDISSSMSGNRLALAKSQLKSSLRMLQPGQSFQVLFYNEATTQMKLRNRPVQNLYPATAVCVQLAEAEIDRVTATSGTEHYQPILQALQLNSDVVYFLTDGAEPALTPSELRTLKDANRHGAQIHVVEFSSGVRESRQISWLEVLAAQSRGRYIPIRNAN